MLKMAILQRRQTFNTYNLPGYGYSAVFLRPPKSHLFSRNFDNTCPRERGLSKLHRVSPVGRQTVQRLRIEETGCLFVSIGACWELSSRRSRLQETFSRLLFSPSQAPLPKRHPPPKLEYAPPLINGEIRRFPRTQTPISLTPSFLSCPSRPSPSHAASLLMPPHRSTSQPCHRVPCSVLPLETTLPVNQQMGTPVPSQEPASSR
jgi:hypothetical protein